MSHRTYTIRWISGDIDSGLTQGDVMRIASEERSEWIDAEIVKDGVRVGSVVLEGF